MEFGVLGPLRVSVDGSDVDVPGAKERTVLAHLVAYVGRAVPTADLIESLWGEDPPRTAAKSLQTFVLRLRNLLEPDRGPAATVIVTDGAGYRLAVQHDMVDATRFSRLCDLAVRALADGRPSSALEAAQDALTLWRGPAYAGCEDTAFGRAEARRLEELRLLATETRVAATLESGRPAAAVAELERLVGEHPLRERLWELLIVGLYRSGRQADALGAFERVRALLADELGVDPRPELRELHARVLAQDPGLVPARAGSLPAGLRSDGRPLVGREEELDRLWRGWQRTGAGVDLTIAVRGPRGAGAMRLAAALASEVEGEGEVVLLTPDAVPTLPRERGLVVVAGGRVPSRHRGLLLVLAGPDADVPDGAEVVDLHPLGNAEIRRLVSEYVGPADVGPVADEILANGPGWPGRVHAEAGRLARAVATRRVVAAIDEAGSSSRQLASARAELSDGLVVLAEAREAGLVPRGTCPWKGLASYDVDDAPWFAGRERLVAEMVARLSTARLLAVVGASGSGKSSAVRAGMLAALRQDVVPGSSGWRQVVVRPGAHPLRALATAALGAGTGNLGDLLAHMIRDDDPGARTLLVVDQMEEVWTACQDEGERAAFLGMLADLAGDPHAQVSVVLAIRAEYVAALAEVPALAGMVADNTVLVGSPTAAEMERAVLRPAARAGLTLEDGLAQTLVADAGAEPGLLPLLSVALTSLWAARVDGLLTYDAYVRQGGLAGSITGLAESVWEGLDGEARVAVRGLLLRLAGPGDGEAVTRRQATRSEIAALELPSVRVALRALVEARLVSAADGHIEVAHEALFRAWPRLRGWLADDTAGRAVQARLAAAAFEWEAEGRDLGALWRGARLESGLDLALLRPEEITTTERAFLEASERATRAEQDEVEARAVSTAAQNRRLRLLLVGAIGFLALALVAGALALRARANSDRSADEARSAARVADAKRLAADALNEDQPAVGLLKAVEAVRREGSPETYGALLTLLTRSPDIATRFRIPDRILRVSSSADGGTLYLSDNRGRLHALDALSGNERWAADVPEGDGQWGTPAADPKGRWIAVPLLGDPRAGVLAVLDPETGVVRRRVREEALRAAADGWTPGIDEGAAVFADGVVLSGPSHAFLIDPDTGSVRRALPFGPHAPFATLLPGGRLAGQDESTTRVLDLRSGAETVHPGAIVGVRPDGRRLVTSTPVPGAEAVNLTLHDGAWSPLDAPVRVSGFVREVVFLPGGRELAVGRDEVVDVHDAGTLDFRRTLSGHSGAVLGLELAGPARDLLWTAGRDGTAVAFDLSGTRGLLRTRSLDVPANIGRAATDRAVITVFYDDRLNTLRLLDLDRGTDLHGEFQPVGECECQPGSTDISPRGDLAVVGIDEFVAPTFDHVTDHGRVAVLDADTGKVRRVIETPWAAVGVVLTPDARRVLVNGSGGWALYDLATGRTVWQRDDTTPVERFPGGPQAAVSPDGRKMLVARQERLLSIDPDSGEVVEEGKLPGSGVLGRLTFAADGRTVAVGSMSGRLYVHDAATLEEVVPPRLVTPGFVIDLQVSPDGELLAALGTDGDVTLFDTSTWRPYGKPVVDGLGWGFLSFTAESLRIYGEFGDDYELPTDPRAWVDAACRVANTEFTAEESRLVRPGARVRPTCD